ncbi:MAG: flagellar protein FlbB [Alphaproteobacteria bacterium]|nr:flagellar protein FlbB [Alphaproteobacteria bacterium]
MNFNNLKIIPLLVLVSALSFSVRLVEVAVNVTSAPGTAAAADTAEHEQDAEMAPADETDMAMEEGEAHQGEAEKNSGGLTFSDDHGVEPPEWRDPVDDDPAFEAVRMEVFQDLAKRRQELESKEQELTTREALLRAAEQELDRKYQELSQLRQQIEGLLEEQSEEEMARIKSLVKIYETMKPKDAARIFDTLDLDILTAVTAEMSERRLSPILAAMNPERARTITTILAEQKQLPTLPDSN